MSYDPPPAPPENNLTYYIECQVTPGTKHIYHGNMIGTVYETTCGTVGQRKLTDEEAAFLKPCQICEAIKLIPPQLRSIMLGAILNGAAGIIEDKNSECLIKRAAKYHMDDAMNFSMDELKSINDIPTLREASGEF